MPFYYAFNYDKAADLDAAFGQKQGGGFFYFSQKNKLIRDANIPTSNTDPTPPKWYRGVMSLEVATWAAEDAALKAAAEAAAEFWTEDNLAFLEYLNTPDVV